MNYYVNIQTIEKYVAEFRPWNILFSVTSINISYQVQSTILHVSTLFIEIKQKQYTIIQLSFTTRFISCNNSLNKIQLDSLIYRQDKPQPEK